MGPLGLGLWPVLGGRLSGGGGAPAPAAGALSSTEATKTSGAGQSPLVVSVTMGADIAAGDWLNIQRSASDAKTGLDYTDIDLQIAHQLTFAERDDGFISEAALAADGYTQPSGLFYEQYWWSRNDGSVGPRSEITDTIALYTAKFSTTRRRTNAGSAWLLSESDRRGTGEGTGGGAFIQGASDQTLVAATGYVEAQLVVRGAGSDNTGIGIINETHDITSLGTGLHNSANAVGLRVQADGTAILYKNAVLFVTAAGVVSVGGWVGLFGEKATGKVWARTDAGWINGDPDVQPDGSVGPSATGGTVLSGTLSFAAYDDFRGSSWRVNAGQDAFVLSPGFPGWA